MISSLVKVPAAAGADTGALDPSNREYVINFSVTVSIDRGTSAERFEWITSVHIPDVSESRAFPGA